MLEDQTTTKIFAPICLFVYNRLWHTKQTIDALKNNNLASESELFIFSDGAKNDEAIASVNDVRSYIQSIIGFKKVRIILRETNLGLAKNIISGVSVIVNLYKQVIVLEDDLVSSPYFLKFMNDALDLYKDDESVASIHGYVYPINDLPETFFLKGTDCWGWATWERTWAIFEPNGKKILKEIREKKLENEIDYNNSTNYIKMLKDQINGKNDSWAIRWHLSAFLKNKLTLYPGKSFIKNTGCDYSGQNSIATKVFDPIMCDKYVKLEKIQVIENNIAKKKFEIFFRKFKKNIFVKGFYHFENKAKSVFVKAKINSKLKNLLLNALPPFIYLNLVNKLLKNRWHGNYPSWVEAKSKATGYDDEVILNQVHQSLFKVKIGISKYERDSVLFDKIVYSWPLLTGLMITAAKSKGKIHVLDFGGSLGSTFYQNKKILDFFEDVKWNIIEQNKFVSIGKRDFENKSLKFYFTIEECLNEQSPNILILASVIQYLEKPYNFLEDILSQTDFDCIIIDRTPFLDDKERIVVQTVPPNIYEASYPCHVFNLSKLKTYISTYGYQLFEEFDTDDGKKNDIYFKGLIYFRKNYLGNSYID